jgi:glycosyltransferase involved in cell wall biosynthesis
LKRSTRKIKPSDLKVAIAVDNIIAWDGGAQVVKTLLEVFPSAVIYTAISDKEVVKKYFPDVKVVNSFIQYLPFEKALRRELLLLYPWAFRAFSFFGFDLVISATPAFAKFLKPWSRKTKHIYYCHTPPKFFWQKKGRTIKGMERPSYKFYSFFQGTILERIWQYWDRKAARAADVIISNSDAVGKRVEKYYGVECETIHPPVDTSALTFNPDNSTRENWYLYLGRVETYKGVELAIRACIDAKVPLKIAGTGQHLEQMRELVKEKNAKGTVKFLGYVEDPEKYELLSKCRALIFPVVDEDFGIVVVEAQGSGAPVIAYRSGGPKEIISEKDPKTGVFFDKYTSEELSKILRSFDPEDINPDNCRQVASQFDSEIFKYKFKNLAEDVVRNGKKST